MSMWAKKINHRILILFFAVLVCVIITVYFASKGETGVYTQLFYIPILLAGVWYHKKAVYLALFLSISYIIITYPLTYHLPIDVLERSVIFVLVAYVVGLVSEKQAKGEEKLRETKDYLDDIITSSADAIAVVDMEGIVRSWNTAAEDYMGYTAEEVIGANNKKFFADQEEAEKIMRIVRRDGALKNYRTIVLNKAKKPVHISMSAALLKDKDGVPIGTVRVSRDITKEVELEKKIKEERDNLDLILESMDDGVYIISKDYEVEFMNKVLIDAFGYHVGEICYDVFHNRAEPCPQCKNTAVMKGETVRWEWHSRRQNKTYDLVETPQKNIDGTISKLTIFRDISDRKRMEDELRDAEERYRVIFEHALTALCVIEHGEAVSLANKEFETLSGYTREEIRGKKWTDFIADVDKERVQNYCEERRKGEAPACCPFKFVNRTGEIRHVNAWIEPIPGDNTCIASLLDITELKRKENELRETCEKLTALDVMKRDFLNVAYHEMRSPLAPIVGYASLLERCELPDTGRKYLHNIEQSAMELDKMINRMLELATIDGKKTDLILKEFLLPEVVQEVVKSFEPVAKKKQQVISSVVPEVEIQADREKTAAIFSNLISNAIKYSLEGGRIDIRVEDRGKDICVCIEDTGIGIPEDHLPKIFERFYMVDTSLTRKSGSLGLGLSIVKEYVKLHGGRVWATSEVEKGSKFFFIMPKRQK
jgi:PAS domain S-box-containing protein